MRELHNVLAVVNMSALDEEVIKRAVSIAKESRIQLHIVHAVNIPLLDIEITAEYLSEQFDEKAIRKEIEQKIRRLSGQVVVEYVVHVARGDAPDIVMHTAEKVKADLIIMGSHGRPTIEERYFGSTANTIAQESGRPVLVIKNSVQGAYKKILAPTDLSDASRKSILFAKKAFPSSPIRLLFTYEEMDDLHVVFYELDPGDGEEPVTIGRPEVDIFRQRVGIQKMDMIRSSKPLRERLLERIKMHQSDLVILGSGGSDAVGSFLGSVASYLLRETPSDAVIYVPADPTEDRQ